MLDKIHVLISILAALVVTVVSIIDGTALSVFAFRLIVVIVLFFVIGTFVRSYLRHYVFIENDLSEEESLEDGNENDLARELEPSDNFDGENKL